jgi:hypothetical protein
VRSTQNRMSLDHPDDHPDDRTAPSESDQIDAAVDVSCGNPTSSILSDGDLWPRNRKVEGSNPSSGSKTAGQSMCASFRRLLCFIPVVIPCARVRFGKLHESDQWSTLELAVTPRGLAPSVGCPPLSMAIRLGSSARVLLVEPKRLARGSVRNPEVRVGRQRSSLVGRWSLPLQRPHEAPSVCVPQRVRRGLYPSPLGPENERWSRCNQRCPFRAASVPRWLGFPHSGTHTTCAFMARSTWNRTAARGSKPASTTRRR